MPSRKEEYTASSLCAIQYTRCDDAELVVSWSCFCEADTLRVAPNFYKERTLHYILGAKDPLLSAFRAAEAPIFEMQERGGV